MFIIHQAQNTTRQSLFTLQLDCSSKFIFFTSFSHITLYIYYRIYIIHSFDYYCIQLEKAMSIQHALVFLSTMLTFINRISINSFEFYISLLFCSFAQRLFSSQQDIYFLSSSMHNASNFHFKYDFSIDRKTHISNVLYLFHIVYISLYLFYFFFFSISYQIWSLLSK